MILTEAQIEDFATRAGFVGADVATAVAIARAESGGDPQEYDPETAFFIEHKIPFQVGRGSHGLWQIFRYIHPEFDGWNLEDPQQNACAAHITYVMAGRSFEPWSTFRSGKYKEFLESSAT